MSPNAALAQATAAGLGAGLPNRVRGEEGRPAFFADPAITSRCYADNQGKPRFGITAAMNGKMFAGSVELLGLEEERPVDPMAIADLLEQMAGFIRGGGR
jgi:hypothetical protein